MNKFINTMKEIKSAITVANNPMLVDHFFYNADVKNYMDKFNIDRKTVLNEHKTALADIIHFEKHKTFKNWIKCYHSAMDEKTDDNFIYCEPNVAYYYLMQYNIVASFDLGIDLSQKFQKNKYHQFECIEEKLSYYANFLPMVRSSSLQPHLIEHIAYIIDHEKIKTSFLKQDDCIRNLIEPIIELPNDKQTEYFKKVFFPLEQLGIDVRHKVSDYVNNFNEMYSKDKQNDFEQYYIERERNQLENNIQTSNLQNKRTSKI